MDFPDVGQLGFCNDLELKAGPGGRMGWDGMYICMYVCTYVSMYVISVQKGSLLGSEWG